MNLKAVVISFVILFQVTPIEAQPDRTDHPLISAYEGSTVRRKDVNEFDEYRAFTGMDETGEEPTSIDLEGRVTKILYTAPKDRSILEVYRNYESAVQQSGAEVLYSCNQKKMECAARYAGPIFQKVSDIHSMSNLDGRYLLAKIDQGTETAYLAVAVGISSTTIHVIEVKAMDVGLVSLDAEALGKGLDARGFVVVEGIFFDTDKATIQSRSTQALAEMAKLLQSRSDLSVFIVGHTDSVGSFEHNQALSRNRANTVVEVLANSHGIERSRMEAHGVGPLAPQASNEGEGGRAKNRRVVLVAR